MNLVVLLLPLALLAGACSRADVHAAARETLEKAQTAIEELKQKTGQAAEDHRPELEQLARDLDRRRQELLAQIAEWKERGAEKYEKERRELEPRLQELEREAREALEKLRR